jgi:hypothetical protein
VGSFIVNQFVISAMKEDLGIFVLQTNTADMNAKAPQFPNIHDRAKRIP